MERELSYYIFLFAVIGGNLYFFSTISTMICSFLKTVLLHFTRKEIPLTLFERAELRKSENVENDMRHILKKKQVHYKTATWNGTTEKLYINNY